MPEDTKKERRKVVIEEVGSESESEPKIEVPAKTEPHIEPGIHEEAKPAEDSLAENPIKKEPPNIVEPSVRVGPNPLVIIIPGIFLLGALLGGIIYYQKNTKISVSVEPKATSFAVVATPSPVATPTIDLEKYSVKILNGSGIVGEAGKAQDIIEEAGFKVSSTGNAANYNYTKSIIQVKEGVEEAFIAELSKALSETYEIDTKTQALTASSADSVVLIVGSTKK
jgi:hypothetical protein